MDYKSLVQKYGSPLYLYDFDAIEKNYLRLKEAFRARKSLVAYAVKANSNLSVLKHLGELGAGCDCVSIGEVRRALMAGIKPYKIIFSGVGKKDEELEEALKSDILMINIESLGEFSRLEKIACECGKIARISVRVNPNIDPKTHPYISTGLHENKFGVNIEEAKKIYLKAKNSPHIEPVGIHFHIGSQLMDLDPIKEAAGLISSLVHQLKTLEIDIKFFDIGGGLGINYEGEKTIAPYDYAQAILEHLGGLDVTIVCEPGRFIVGNSGVFVSRVLYEKKNGDKRFVIIDGAMNDLLRPSLYDAFHGVELIGGSGEESKADVVGPVCESGDFLAKDVLLKVAKHDDIVVIKSAGAYCFSMSSNYNSRLKVAEVALQGGETRLIRRRESFEDMIRLEKDCL
ncbi:MAG: diaminopimelate decarboxylase [Proteobacteria bacterium]|nr:MAG: diaminopimelate decarboxylase [Pseudomonadota bacterium]